MEKTLIVINKMQLVAIMIQTGRPKDMERLVRFIEEMELSLKNLDEILIKHHLKIAFKKFKDWYDEKKF